MLIGEKVIREASNQIEGLMRDYLSDINDAYANAGTLAIGLKANIEGTAGGGMDVVSEISFIKEKIKDKSLTKTVYENQEEIKFPVEVTNGTREN